MPILNGVQHDFFSEETDTESPNAEQLMQKYGENLMFLNGIQGNLVTFLTSNTFLVPEGIERVFIVAAGGGGGGGGGQFGSGGGGGVGCAPFLLLAPVTPLETLTITIGAGGAGGAYTVAGGAGGNTTIVSLFRTYLFPGGLGGYTSPSSTSTVRARSTSLVTDIADGPRPAFGGGGGTIAAGANTNPSLGQNTMYGVSGSIQENSASGGGPGGAGHGNGGAGGSFVPVINATNASDNSSAGGGGGYRAGGAGANGGSGICYIIY